MSAETRPAFGAFLDDLPKALYVLVHLVMLGIGIGVWAQVRNTPFPHPGALLLYVTSQVIFLGFFAKAITLKMAVLLEQLLMLAMVCALTVGAF